MTPERKIELLERTLNRREKFWLEAAREALDGDMRKLRNRVEMYEAAPVQVVLSDES